MREVVVIGAGLHRYGVFPEKSISAIGTEAIRNALEDANMSWEEIEVAYCGTSQPSMSTGHGACGWCRWCMHNSPVSEVADERVSYDWEHIIAYISHHRGTEYTE
jgi:L-lysine 2,3-aminomutase